jgi:hypothetical protein
MGIIITKKHERVATINLYQVGQELSEQAPYISKPLTPCTTYAPYVEGYLSRNLYFPEVAPSTKSRACSLLTTSILLVLLV